MAYTFKTDDSTNLELINALEINGVEYKLDALLAANKAASVETKVGKKLQDIVIKKDEVGDDPDSTWRLYQEGAFAEYIAANEDSAIIYSKSDVEDAQCTYVSINNSDPILCELSCIQGTSLISPYGDVGAMFPSTFGIMLYPTEDRDTSEQVYLVEGILFSNDTLKEYVSDTDNSISISITTVDLTVSRSHTIEPNYCLVALKIDPDDSSSTGKKWYYKVKKIKSGTSIVSKNNIIGYGLIDFTDAVFPSSDDFEVDDQYIEVSDVIFTGFPSPSGYDITNPVFNLYAFPFEFKYYYNVEIILNSESSTEISHHGDLPDGMIFDTDKCRIFVNKYFIENNKTFDRSGKVSFEYTTIYMGLLSQIDHRFGNAFTPNSKFAAMILGVYSEDIAKRFLTFNSMITVPSVEGESFIEPSTLESLDAELVKKVIFGESQDPQEETDGR